jgi:hypothetical protein
VGFRFNRISSLLPKNGLVFPFFRKHEVPFGFKTFDNQGVAEKTENIRHISVRKVVAIKPELTRLLKEAAAVGFEHCPAK